ncbi:MAG: tRNA adenosine(34) deaminase TadA [Deltaproteobacteria bacterium]|nr:tRNA adenosine(34) deaminase TadA [Deltaproteobacteria bacterium]
MELDIKFMKLALSEAEKAGGKGEVPIGAVIVTDGRVIARGHNLRESKNDPTAHAEMIAVRKAAKKLNSWRLINSTLYVTVEPCVMCIGAIVLARIPRLVFGCLDPKGGAVGSLYDISNDKRLNHRVEVRSGVMAEEAQVLLKDFFKKLRKSSGR